MGKRNADDTNSFDLILARAIDTIRIAFNKSCLIVILVSVTYCNNISRNVFRIPEPDKRGVVWISNNGYSFSFDTE